MCSWRCLYLPFLMKDSFARYINLNVVYFLSALWGHFLLSSESTFVVEKLTSCQIGQCAFLAVFKILARYLFNSIIIALCCLLIIIDLLGSSGTSCMCDGSLSSSKGTGHFLAVYVKASYWILQILSRTW